MLKDMLGIATRKLVTLPSEVLGIVCDLLEKLTDPVWVSATKRFLRKQNPWPSGVIQVTPFDPVEFIGKGWSIDEQDERSLKLNEVDLAKVKFETCLKEGETIIKGEEKLKRLKNTGYTRLDARFFLTLWQNQHLIPEAWKEKTNGNTTLIFFDGTVLRRPDGGRFVLFLFWRGGRWSWHCRWLGHDWDADRPSVVLASN